MTSEMCTVMEDRLNKNFAAYRKGRRFVVTSRQDQNAQFLTVTLSSPDRTYVYPVEGRAEKAQDAVDILFDFIESYFEEYFKSDEATYLPIDWAPYEYAGREISVQGQILNMKLEEEANRILAGAGETNRNLLN